MRVDPTHPIPDLNEVIWHFEGKEPLTISTDSSELEPIEAYVTGWLKLVVVKRMLQSGDFAYSYLTRACQRDEANFVTVKNTNPNTGSFIFRFYQVERAYRWFIPSDNKKHTWVYDKKLHEAEIIKLRTEQKDMQDRNCDDFFLATYFKTESIGNGLWLNNPVELKTIKESRDFFVYYSKQQPFEAICCCKRKKQYVNSHEAVEEFFNRNKNINTIQTPTGEFVTEKEVWREYLETKHETK